MAKNLFSQAAAYRKKHPSVSQAEAVQICAKENRKGGTAKKAARKPSKKAAGRKPAKAHHKKTAPKKIAAAKKPPRTVKISFKKKSMVPSVRIGGISGISLAKVHTELQHQHGLKEALEKHRQSLKEKGLKPIEKAQIRKDMTHYRNAIAASKKHVSALKRSI